MPSVSGEGAVCSDVLCANFHVLFGTFRTVHTSQHTVTHMLWLAQSPLINFFHSNIYVPLYMMYIYR